MKGKWILPIVCVLVMVSATSGVSAVSHDFGTAEALLQDDDVTATVPVIDNWVYKLEVELAAFLDVEVDCEFRDDAGAVDEFSFIFRLSIEKWTKNPPAFDQYIGSDEWSVSNEDSTNWNNVPVVYTDTISVEIGWIPLPHYHMYKCILDVTIDNHDIEVSDSDQETWFINCTLN